MKQKIIIKVQVRCDKCRSNAMETAAAADGVISVALDGEYKDKVVVIGDGVDAADLTIQLNKKLGHASLEMVEEVQENVGNENEDQATQPPSSPSSPTTPYPPCYYQNSCEYELFRVVIDPQPSSCTIM
ncbi:heavy metal-associated isoprenylated plant protein 47-like [Pistacia vera]|uniref:heavy metal-associated isoprenylated plant protein 47-like n=1 Tax=Pistacia vera TaxID=55513 RepID=UPI00126361C4|nr:heavy metal-associated isoprenylated plant protein 47-like [Pistacia vera]